MAIAHLQRVDSNSMKSMAGAEKLPAQARQQTTAMAYLWV
jgi:hypothetical protein